MKKVFLFTAFVYALSVGLPVIDVAVSFIQAQEEPEPKPAPKPAPKPKPEPDFQAIRN
jgi:hypothetical protein